MVTVVFVESAFVTVLCNSFTTEVCFTCYTDDDGDDDDDDGDSVPITSISSYDTYSVLQKIGASAHFLLFL